MDCTVRAIRKRIALGKLDAVTIINKDNRPQYQIAISSLPPSAQEKYYARQRAELAAPADALSASTAKALKPVSYTHLDVYKRQPLGLGILTIASSWRSA